MANGLLSEFERVGYGKDIGDVLATIGQSVKQARQEKEAQSIIGEAIPQLNINEPDYQTKIGSILRQAVGMSPQLQSNISDAIQTGAVQPGTLKIQQQQANRQLEKDRIDALRIKQTPFDKQLQDYNVDLRSPNTSDESLQNQHDILQAQRDALIKSNPEYKDMLPTVPDPVQNRVKVRPDITNDNGTYLYQKQSDGTYAYSLARDKDGKVIPAKSNASLIKENGLPGLKEAFNTADFSKTGDEFLSQIPLQFRAMAQGLANYTLDAKTITSLRSGSDRTILSAFAKQINPEFDFTSIDARKKVVESFKSGKDYAIDTALNQATAHFGEMSNAIDDLKNRDNRFWNAVANAGIRNFTGDAAVDRFNFAAAAVVNEVDRAFAGRAATDQGFKHFKESLSSAASESDLKGVVDEGFNLLKDRFKAQGEGWKSGTGLPVEQLTYDDPNTERKNLNLLYPESRAVFQKLGREDIVQEILTGKASGTTSQSQDKFKVGQQYKDKTTHIVKTYRGNGVWE